MALDRIISIDYDFNLPYLEEDFDADLFYKNVIGVTVNTGSQPRRIELWIDPVNAPYVLTKPLHSSQRLIKQNEDQSIIVHIFLTPNYEMERILLGFGDGIEVIKPENLRNRMKKILEKAISRYSIEDKTELNA